MQRGKNGADDVAFDRWQSLEDASDVACGNVTAWIRRFDQWVTSSISFSANRKSGKRRRRQKRRCLSIAISINSFPVKHSANAAVTTTCGLINQWLSFLLTFKLINDVYVINMYGIFFYQMMEWIAPMRTFY